MNIQYITGLVQQWAKTEETGDTSKLDELLTNDFIGIGPKGFVLTRQQWLQRFSGGLKYESITVNDVQATCYDKAAIAVARQSQKATFNDNRADAELRMMQTWVEDSGTWKLAALQYSTIDMNIPGRPQQ